MMADDPIARPTIMMKPPNEADCDAADLMEIAAAIDRIAAEIAIGERPATGAFDAIERIQDIAFVLHERSIEQTLCDALDTAVRDLSDASARSHAAAERVRNANNLLGALATRVRELIALTTKRRHNDSTPAATSAVRSIDERLARVSMECASLELDMGDAAPPRASVDGLAAEQADNVMSPRSDGAPGEHRPNDNLLPPVDLDTGVTMDQTGERSHPAHGDEASAHLPSCGVEAFSGSGNDPGDLIKRDVGVATNTAADLRTGPANSVRDTAPLHDANAPPARASSRPLAKDALAAVRALSEEELIALFS